MSQAVAIAVGRAVVNEGAAPLIPANTIDARIKSVIWEPVYRPYHAR